jgi:hypothetical protein
MTMIECEPGRLLRYKLEFLKPFQTTNVAEFTFEPKDGQTVVTWSMAGRNAFLFKLIGIFMDCDKMIGPMFEKGLADLKTLSEAEARG